MRLAELGKRLGFHANKATFAQFLEQVSALLDRVDYGDRGHLKTVLGKYNVWLDVSVTYEAKYGKGKRK